MRRVITLLNGGANQYLKLVLESFSLPFLMSYARENIKLISNLMSVAFMGVIGICLNLLIVFYYGLEVLGYFNFIFAIYITVSQFTALGLHYSILQKSSYHSEDHNVLSLALTNAMVLSFMIAIPVLVLAHYIIIFLADHTLIKDSLESWYVLIPGLLLFSFNKINLFFINGVNRMVLYSVLVSFRYLCMLITLFCIMGIGLDYKYVSLILTIPELLVFVVSSYYLKGYFNFHLVDKKWLNTHLVFSCRSFLAGASIELNSRVDVLILSAFTTARAVGIYAFALLLVEGIMQLIVVFRNQINPFIPKHFSRDNVRLQKEMHKIGLYALAIVFMASIVVLISLYIYTHILTQSVDLSESLKVLFILLSGLLFSAYYMPLQFFPNQIGRPAQQTYLNLSILITNFILNLPAAYFYGLYGAAFATAFSFLVSNFIIRGYVRRCLNQ